MQISHAEVSFSSQHELQRRQQMREVSACLVPRNDLRGAANNKAPKSDTNTIAPSSHIKTDLSALVRQHLQSLPNDLGKSDAIANEISQSVDADVLLIKQILETYFGQKIRLALAAVEKSQETSVETELAVSNSEAQAVSEEKWVHLSLQESERSAVAISAQITLCNGKTISICLEETMARRLSIEKTMREQDAVKIIDPLVINFGRPVRLSVEKAEFDLNADGVKDSIARFASHSAYIAWDKNKDGRINDGSELFGVASGNGFADLAQFDEDGNGFIDSGDSVFSELKLFRPGEQTLATLSSRGVQALYLDSVVSPFQLDDANGDVAGRVRSTGFYISSSQNGGAGTLQQIDLVI